MKSREIQPPNWDVVPLSDAATVIQGQSPPGASYNTNGKGLPFFQGKAEFTDLSPVASKWCSEPAKIAQPGDVLISVRAPVGPTNLADVECCVGRGLAAIRPLGGIPSKFLLYYLRYTESDIAGKGIGTTFSAISGHDLRSHRVFVPPLPEQSRIVAAIETQVTRLDATAEALERARANLKRYRASVLSAAVAGELSAASGARETFSNSRWVPIDQIVSSLDQGWSPRCMSEGSSDPNVWSVIKTTAVQSLEFDGAANKMLPSHLRPRPVLEIAKGDVLITRAGPRARVGICCLVSTCQPRLMLCDKVYRLRLNRDRVDPRFLAVVLNSWQLQRDIEKLKSGINDSGLNLTQKGVLQLRIPLPPLDVQGYVAQAVDGTITAAQRMEGAISGNLVRVAKLRESVLKWAFEGKLADQDPNDEPASVLLQRIRAERAAVAPSPKTSEPSVLQPEAAK